MWYALKWGSQCLVIWGLSLFSTSAIFRDYFFICFLMYSTCIKTCQLFIAHHYVISFKDKCHWEWLLSLSGYWVKICFVGSRVLLRDIEDPSGSAKLFTKSRSESQIKMCILLAPHGALAVIAFRYYPTLPYPTLPFPSLLYFPNILLKPLTVTRQLLNSY